MKKNVWRIVWIVGIYAVLVTILYMVVIYKVKWEDRDLNTYLYFYNCSGRVCTSSDKQHKYYSAFLCKKKKCPHVTEMNSTYAVLSDNKNSYIFDYVNNKLVSGEYIDYKLLYGKNQSLKN